MRNRQIRLISRPTDIPQPEDFCVEATDLGGLADGQFRVRNQLLSIDPSMRGWLADPDEYGIAALGRKSQRVAIGEVMRSLAAGEVIESHHPDFTKGDLVTGWFGWQDYADVTPEAVVSRVTAFDLPLSLWLGILGMNGVTAFVGLELYPELGPEKTVVVSTAAGAVGSVVGQIAKGRGARVVGITGGAAKCEYCREVLGFDHVVDYKNNGFAEDLEAALPDGADLYFDNTAGSISDEVILQMAIGGKIIVCGTSAVNSWNPAPLGPRIERPILAKRLTVQGFVAFDEFARWPEIIDQLAERVRDGSLKYREDIVEGLERAPGSIADLYNSVNLGKRLIRL